LHHQRGHQKKSDTGQGEEKRPMIPPLACSLLRSWQYDPESCTLDPVTGLRPIRFERQKLGVASGLFRALHKAGSLRRGKRPLKTVDIESGTLEGGFPKRALQYIMEWYDLHKLELMDNWELSRKKLPLRQIPPLE
jgi:hypothetical protein